MAKRSPKVEVISEIHPLQRGEPVKPKALNLLPPPKGVCQVCATDHPGDQPHNQQSLYYQYAFYGTHGRWPTWRDAMAHCAPEIQEQWQGALAQLGHWPPRGEEVSRG